MIVAYLFSTHSLGDYYGQPIRRRFWTNLVALGDKPNTLHIAEGDLLVSRFDEFAESRLALTDRLSGWTTNDPCGVRRDRLYSFLETDRVYLEVIQGISADNAARLHQCLLDESGEAYLGCVTVNPSDPIHRTFYLDYTSLYATYEDGRLNLYHTDAQPNEFLSADGMDQPLDIVDGDLSNYRENGTSDE